MFEEQLNMRCFSIMYANGKETYVSRDISSDFWISLLWLSSLVTASLMSHSLVSVRCPSIARRPTTCCAGCWRDPSLSCVLCFFLSLFRPRRALEQDLEIEGEVLFSHRKFCGLWDFGGKKRSKVRELSIVEDNCSQKNELLCSCIVDLFLFYWLWVMYVHW